LFCDVRYNVQRFGGIMSIRRNSQRRDSLSTVHPRVTQPGMLVSITSSAKSSHRSAAATDYAPAARGPQIVDPLWMISVAAAFLFAVLAVLVASG
jgi:hypothetical protein